MTTRVRIEFEGEAIEFSGDLTMRQITTLLRRWQKDRKNRADRKRSNPLMKRLSDVRQARQQN